MTKTVLFQFCISTLFSSIWPIDRTLSGATTLGQSGPCSNGNTPHSPKLQHYWSLTIRFFRDISRTLVGWGRALPHLQRSCWCILQPQPTEKSPSRQPLLLLSKKSKKLNSFLGASGVLKCNADISNFLPSPHGSLESYGTPASKPTLSHILTK